MKNLMQWKNLKKNIGKKLSMEEDDEYEECWELDAESQAHCDKMKALFNMSLPRLLWTLIRGVREKANKNPGWLVRDSCEGCLIARYGDCIFQTHDIDDDDSVDLNDIDKMLESQEINDAKIGQKEPFPVSCQMNRNLTIASDLFDRGWLNIFFKRGVIAVWKDEPDVT